MNKIYKVIWNEARNAYVVVSEIAKNHGSKSSSTKKLLAMLIATGVMTCASFDVLAAQPAAETTAAQQYVALKAADFPAKGPSMFDKNTWGGLDNYGDARTEYNYQIDGSKNIGDYTYTYDKTNKYWVRDGYVLTVDENGGEYTPLSANKIHADVAYTGTGVPEGILQSVTSTVSANGTVTNMGESLNKVTAGSFAGVSHSGGTEVAGSWNYIIQDSSWKNSGAEYQNGYVDLIGNEMPKGFITAESNKGLVWDKNKQAYIYKGKAVDYSNVYVIDGKIGVFTNKEGTKVYTGTVYGKNNEILMTVKDKDNKFYSYWAAEVTDPSATMATYRVEEYKKNLAVLEENDNKLSRDDIKKVTLDTSKANSATIGLLRNGDKAVEGAITVTSGGGTDGSGADKDTFVKISNGKTEQTFATGSKVKAIGTKEATTGIKINGEDYTIKSGSEVSVKRNEAEKTTTITVDGTATTITDTDTTYTEGDGIEISGANAISVSKNLTGMQSINGAGGTINLAGSAITVNETTFNKDGRIQNVANGTETKDAVNFGQLQETNNKVDNLTTEVGKGWTVATENGTATKVGAGDTVKFIGDDNIVVSNTGKNVVVKLGKDLTGLTSVTTKNAYVTNVDASNNKSVTNVGYVNNQIAGVTLTEGKGISITDKKINVKLKDGEENLKVDETGLYLRKDLTGMESITGVGGGKISFATGGNVTINKITFNKDGRIQGIEAGIDNNDAVNVKQLNEVVAAGDTDVHIQADNYTVDKNNKVSMNLVDKAGNDKGTVTITGVAKAEDVAVVYDKNKTSLRSTNATVKENAIALGQGAFAVKNSIAIGNGAYTQDGTLTKGQSVALGNGAVTGAKSTSIGSNAIGGREGTITIGANANNGSLYATIIGTDSVINSDETAYKVKIDTFLGTIEKDVNIQGATATLVGTSNKVDNKNNLVYSGVANNVMGAANTIEASNGVTIQGTGNKVTDAYKDMNITPDEGLAILGGDYSVLAKKQSGAIAVVGGANTVSRQTDSTVIGYDNKLTGDKEKGSHDVFMAGSHNELTNVSDSIVMGNENAITGVSNVISFGHKNAITANNAVAIGNGAGVSVEGGVALGVGSVASTAAGALGYGADGKTDATWQATKGAVSVGGNGVTRQITNVAAGTEDTDAVNVAQLKKVSEAAASASQGWKLKTQNGNAFDVKPGATVEFDGDANIQVGNDGNKVSVTLKNQLTGIQSITGAGEGAGSISFANDGIKFNNKVTIDNTGKISGVADGKISTDSTDAVNGSQLHAVATEAGKHTTLSNGKNTTVESTVKDGQTDYKVNVAGDLTDITSVANGDSKINLNKDSIIISNGNKYFAITNSGIGMSYIGADYSAKSIMLGENGTTISGGLNVAGSKITGVAAGEVSSTSTDAINGSQLHAVATEAGKHTTLSNGKNTTVNPVTTADGHLEYKVDVNDELKDIKSIIGAGEGAGSISFADGGIKINNKVTINKDGKITGVAAGVEKTDAVNVGQLTDYVAANDTHIKSGNYAVGEVTDSTGNKSQGVSMDIVNKEGKVTGTVTITDVAKASDVGEVNNIDSDIKNQNGSHTTVVDAVNNLNQKLNNKVGDLNYVEGGKGNYVTNGENTTTSIGKLDQALKDVAATAAKHTTVTQGDNITVTPETNTDGSKNYNVALKKDITVESVTANTFKADQTVMNKDGLKVGNKVSVSATAVTAGKTSISDEGVKVGDKTYISDKGLNANDQKVTNVAAGELSATSKDAVNGSQLYETNQAIANNATNISSLSHSISNLDNRVNKVGAGAAALAALHPLDFDPDAKWDFAAGYGNYRGANAAAVGAYYRPNEDTMFSVGGTFGNGENMVNVGVSFKLGSGSNHVSTSRVAMAKEIKELRGELEAMKSAMLDANAGKKIDTSKLQLFPDVPQNHWAYEYVAQLAGDSMIEGYPDGNFAGDRPMTRYEFAAILYRAMTKGAVLSDKILSEFSHELEYFTVDTIAKDKAGNPTIQRVRIVKENKNK